MPHRQTSPAPPGYTTVTPWIISPDTAKLIAFLQQAFGAEEQPDSRMTNEDGSISHVEVKIGDSIVLMFDAHATSKPTPAFLRLYVNDVDQACRTASAAGADVVTEPTELFWGDRIARVRDIAGNIWWLQAHVQDVPQEEMQSRMRAPEMVKGMQYVQESLVEELRTRH